MNGRDGAAFVDTNVLAYAFEIGESPRKAVARELLAKLTAEETLRISTQVLQELFVTLTRKALQPSSVDEAIARLDELSMWPLFSIDYSAVRQAALLSRDAVLSFWDALIVVAAARSGARTLYSEDLSHGQEILGVRVVNPFQEAPAGSTVTGGSAPQRA